MAHNITTESFKETVEWICRQPMPLHRILHCHEHRMVAGIYSAVHNTIQQIECIQPIHAC
jgi:hypothetical protein